MAKSNNYVIYCFGNSATLYIYGNAEIREATLYKLAFVRKAFQEIKKDGE